jgi:hypothetical protein
MRKPATQNDEPEHCSVYLCDSWAPFLVRVLHDSSGSCTCDVQKLKAIELGTFLVAQNLPAKSEVSKLSWLPSNPLGVKLAVMQ